MNVATRRTTFHLKIKNNGGFPRFCIACLFYALPFLPFPVSSDGEPSFTITTTKLYIFSSYCKSSPFLKYRMRSVLNQLSDFNFEFQTCKIKKYPFRKFQFISCKYKTQKKYSPLLHFNLSRFYSP